MVNTDLQMKKVNVSPLFTTASSGLTFLAKLTLSFLCAFYRFRIGPEKRWPLDLAGRDVDNLKEVSAPFMTSQWADFP